MTESDSFKGYQCSKCGWRDAFQATNCPRCFEKVQETQFSTNGKIASYTTIRYPPKGFENESPYVVALIDIEKGPRTIARISTNQTDLKIGQNVRFVREKNGALEFKALT